MLSCPVQVTTVKAGVQMHVQFHVLLALDLPDAPIASEQEAWRECGGQKPVWMLGLSKLLSLAGMEPRPISCPFCSLVTILTEPPRNNTNASMGGEEAGFAERPESEP
jgi:hypothetical protein